MNTKLMPRAEQSQRLTLIAQKLRGVDRRDPVVDEFVDLLSRHLATTCDLSIRDRTLTLVLLPLRGAPTPRKRTPHGVSHSMDQILIVDPESFRVIEVIKDCFGRTRPGDPVYQGDFIRLGRARLAEEARPTLWERLDEE